MRRDGRVHPFCGGLPRMGTLTTNKSWFLNHANGEVYSFVRYATNGIRIRHNGKHVQEIIDGEHHSDGCYTPVVARKLWEALISQGFEFNANT